MDKGSLASMRHRVDIMASLQASTSPTPFVIGQIRSQQWHCIGMRKLEFSGVRPTNLVRL